MPRAYASSSYVSAPAAVTLTVIPRGDPTLLLLLSVGEMSAVARRAALPLLGGLGILFVVGDAWRRVWRGVRGVGRCLMLGLRLGRRLRGSGGATVRAVWRTVRVAADDGGLRSGRESKVVAKHRVVAREIDVVFLQTDDVVDRCSWGI